MLPAHPLHLNSLPPPPPLLFSPLYSPPSLVPGAISREVYGVPQEDKPNPAQKVTLYTEGAADREGKRKNAETEQHHERHGPAPPAPQEEQEETKKQGAVLYRQKEEVDREVGGGQVG